VIWGNSFSRVIWDKRSLLITLLLILILILLSLEIIIWNKVEG
jgi:hypothetical protein